MAPCSTQRAQPCTDVSQLFQQKQAGYAERMAWSAFQCRPTRCGRRMGGLSSRSNPIYNRVTRAGVRMSCWAVRGRYRSVTLEMNVNGCSTSERDGRNLPPNPAGVRSTALLAPANPWTAPFCGCCQTSVNGARRRRKYTSAIRSGIAAHPLPERVEMALMSHKAGTRQIPLPARGRIKQHPRRPHRACTVISGIACAMHASGDFLSTAAAFCPMRGRPSPPPSRQFHPTGADTPGREPFALPA